MEGGIYRHFDEEVPPRATTQPRERGRGGTIDFEGGQVLSEESAQLLSRLGGCSLLRARDNEADEAGEGGEVSLPAASQLLLGEEEKILLQGRLDAVMIGIIRLDYCLSWQRAPTGAAYHLCQEGKGSLSTPKVGEVETNVCRKDTHEGNVRVVVPLGDHLRADDDVNIPTLEAVEKEVMSPAPGCRIPVHPCDAGMGEESLELPFHLLGADPEFP